MMRSVCNLCCQRSGIAGRWTRNGDKGHETRRCVVRGACACRLRAGLREDRFGPRPEPAGMRRIVVTGRAPGNEIEVTPAQLRAEVLAIDRMLEKERRGR